MNRFPYGIHKFLKKKLPLILYPKEYKEPKEEYKVWNMRNNFKKIVRRDENDILLDR